MSLRTPKLARRVTRWVVSAAFVALAPKCVLCVVAYLGLGATLGLTSAEICGGPDSMSPHRIAGWLAAGAALGIIGFFFATRFRTRPATRA